ncbi:MULTISPECIES: hypothetical protein [unclassified Sulfitobacter]|jgi:hypothetical protein|uniref:hypothetical protein n=1 Tax=unclassified Sulfitobacter TaxID=196795 RepID=UPI001594CA11|nr:hypothetical protein [Sulfitobacter sp. HGT1]MBQ0805512.1 hypothetical protein [Sulfitobacter sp.]
MKKRLSILALVAFAATSSASYADRPLTMATGADKTTAFVGFNLVFGSAGVQPEAVLGVAHGNTDSSGDLRGMKASLHFNLLNAFSPSKVKLTGIVGQTDKQVELGFGYSFVNSGVFAVGGVNSNHVVVGADVWLSGGLEGYIGLQSTGKFDEPAFTFREPV